jgi:hypothetical protein
MVEPHSLLSLRKDVAVERIQRLGLRRASQAHDVSSKASLRRAEEYSRLEMSRVRLRTSPKTWMFKYRPLVRARLRSESPAALVFLTLRFLAGPWGPE